MAAGTVGGSHAILEAVNSASHGKRAERSTLSSFWLDAELLTTTRTSISTEEWQPHGKS